MYKWYKVKSLDLIERQYQVKKTSDGVIFQDGYFVNNEMLKYYDKIFINNTDQMYGGWYWDKRILTEDTYLSV